MQPSITLTEHDASVYQGSLGAVRSSRRQLADLFLAAVSGGKESRDRCQGILGCFRVAVRR